MMRDVTDNAMIANSAAHTLEMKTGAGAAFKSAVQLRSRKSLDMQACRAKKHVALSGGGSRGGSRGGSNLKPSKEVFVTRNVLPKEKCSPLEKKGLPPRFTSVVGVRRTT